MTVSHLTDSLSELVAAVIVVLDGEGYSYDPDQTTFNKYLATALTGISGSTASHLQMSTTEMLAALANEMGGETYSHLTHSYAELLSAVANGSFGPSIQLSASTLLEESAEGTAIGTLSVTGGSGTYTFTLTNNAGNKAKVAGGNGVNLQAGSTATNYEAMTTFTITVQADNGVDTPITRVVTINIANAVLANTVAPVVSGTPTEGETLTRTVGTWVDKTGDTTQWYQAVLENPPGDNDVVVDGNGNPLTDDPIVGATSATYDLQASDVGERVFCTVIGTDGTNFVTAFSNVTDVIEEAASGAILDGITGVATGAYSTRKLLTAYAGSAIRVRRSSDDTEQDIGFSSGELDTAALATFVGANNGFIAKWYDQSGNGRDFVQATAANQPQIVATGTLQTINSLAAIKFTAASTHFLSSTATVGNLITASAWTVVAGMNTVTATPTYDENAPAPLISDAATYWTGIATGTRTDARAGAKMYDGGGYREALLSITNGTAFVITNKLGGGTLSHYHDGGTPNTQASSPVGSTTDTTYMGKSTSYYNGYANEVIVFASALSAADINTIGASLAARCGSSWSNVS